MKKNFVSNSEEFFEAAKEGDMKKSLILQNILGEKNVFYEMAIS